MNTTVLIAEPLDSLRTVLQSILNRPGYDVTIAATLLQVQHIIKKLSIKNSVVILDLLLSSSEVPKLAQRLKKQGMKVVLMGVGSTERKIATTLGVPYLEKPFTKAELIQTVETALPPTK